MPVLVASFISGLAGAITQKNLQGASGCGKAGGKNAVLFSAELCIASLIMLGGSLTFNSDGKCIKSKGFFADWTPYTFIPILTNALGGILVGLVTKYAGSVRKGFALIFGLILSGIIQAVTERSGGGSWAISTEEILGGVLASISLWIHVTNPYKEPITEKIDTRANGSQKKVTNGVATTASAKATSSRRSRKSRKED
jgi:UDP-sugar transporter A1/2/3